MKTLLLYPDTHRNTGGILQRLQTQIDGIRAGVEEALSSCTLPDDAPCLVEKIIYRHRDTTAIPTTRQTNQRSLEMASSPYLPVSKINTPEFWKKLEEFELCILILERESDKPFSSITNTDERTPKTRVITIAPTYPLSMVSDELTITDSSEKRQSQTKSGFTVSSTIEADTYFDYELHYEKFKPLTLQHPYVFSKHVLAIFTGDTAATTSATRSLNQWIELNPGKVDGVTLISRSNSQDKNILDSVPVRHVQAAQCTPSQLLSLMGKSITVFVSGNALFADCKQLGIKAMQLDQCTKPGLRLPNSKSVLRELLFCHLSDDSSVSMIASTSNSNEGTNPHADDAVIPLYKLQHGSGSNLPRTKIVSIRRKWKKFNESPRRFFADSDTWMFRPLKHFRS